MEDRVNGHHIPLNPDEEAWLAQIDWGPANPENRRSREGLQANGEPIALLLQSLKDRNALPTVRWKYWTDSEFRVGSGRLSRKQTFEKNGTKGKAIYAHPHFLPHLEYLLYGPALPDAVLAEFEDAVGDPDEVTSGDVLPLGEVARKCVKRHGWEPRDAAEQFFLLALDLGLHASDARTIRDRVMKMRTTGQAKPQRSRES